MKLILCSEGFHTQNSVKKCVELVGKPQDKITFAIINEGYSVELGNKRWVLKNLNDLANNFPAEIDLVNLLALPLNEVEERIMSKDAIFTIGGNTDYLMSVFVKTGFNKLLPKLLESKVYVGSSAGSMVMGKRLSSEVRKTLYDDVTSLDETTEYLRLVDFSFLPHLDSDNENFKYRAEKLTQAAKKHPGKIYGLRDDSAMVIVDGKIEFIGSKLYEFN